MSGYPTLFSPLKVGGKVAKNRVFRAATSTKLSEGNRIGVALLAHYQIVAAGGAGTIVTEALRCHPASGARGGVAVFDDEAIPGLQRLSDTVHDYDALVIGQLNHSGRQHTSTKVPGGLVGPSPVACPRSGGVPHQLSATEIEEFVDYFGSAASRLAVAGFDGVEVHCAQGHLLQQFLSPFSNQRDDAYGGTEQKRWRFPTDVTRRVREAVGPDVLVGLRLGIDEFTPGGLTLEMSTLFALWLVEEGLIDYLSLSQGNFNTIDTHLPDRHSPHAPYLSQQASIKRHLPHMVVVACTRIVTPDVADSIVASGQADAVALSRALIVDPDWPIKSEMGLASTVRLCIGCNECWDGLHEGTSTISCVQNAVAGRELALGTIETAREPRTVVVIGGGPAGLETARVASLRGHRVTLIEQRPQVGGKALLGARLAGHTDLGNVVEFLGPAAEAAGVEIRVNDTATVAGVAALNPDVIVVATGATPISSELPGDGSIKSHHGLPDLPSSLAGRKLVVVDEDGHYWAAQVCEELVDRGAEVVVITRFFEPFRELPSVSRIAALRRLDSAGVQFLPLHSIDRTEASNLHIHHFESTRSTVIEGVSDVVWVGPQLPDDALVGRLRGAGFSSVRVIGDAYAPRRLKDAIHEGHAAGRSI
jgi:2,4-dienoyl-CoA reductase-like NADH-dependent reductase (Old Yellow Enzyme family)